MRTSEKLENRLSYTLTNIDDLKRENLESTQGLTQEDIDLVNEVTELEDLLDEARFQLHYLDDKFKKTGTTASVLSRIKAKLNK